MLYIYYIKVFQFYYINQKNKLQSNFHNYFFHNLYKKIIINQIFYFLFFIFIFFIYIFARVVERIA